MEINFAREGRGFKIGRKKCWALTTNIVFGRIDSHTRPARILVTAKPSVNRSALDCELLDKKVLDEYELLTEEKLWRLFETIYENYGGHKELNFQLVYANHLVP